MAMAMATAISCAAMYVPMTILSTERDSAKVIFESVTLRNSRAFLGAMLATV